MSFEKFLSIVEKCFAKNYRSLWQILDDKKTK